MLVDTTTEYQPTKTAESGLTRPNPTTSHVLHNRRVNDVNYIPRVATALIAGPSQSPQGGDQGSEGTRPRHSAQSSGTFHDAKLQFDMIRASLASEVKPSAQRVREYDARLKDLVKTMIEANDTAILFLRFAFAVAEGDEGPDVYLQKCYDAHLLTRARLERVLDTRDWNA